MSEVAIWFSGWAPIIRIIIVGTFAYFAIVLILRASNKRTLARLNAFDFVITVAIGATFGRVLTAHKVALAEAVTAFALLVFLHYSVGWLRMYMGRSARIITSPPSLLFFRGEFIRQAMHKEHITTADLACVVRHHGADSFDSIDAIVLESSGRFSVIKKQNAMDQALTAQPDQHPGS